MKKQEENIFQILWGNSYTESFQDFFKEKSDKESPLACGEIILEANIEDLFKLQKNQFMKKKPVKSEKKSMKQSMKHMKKCGTKKGGKKK
ncbi:MAG: hypothetical protein ACO21H_01285 [Sediminibacterium sp.]|jgi:hypothetical protein|nr:hypothetical protein [Pseudomonadota bacterium]NCA28464.1 hypothetical protein [Pseudomonadota bacterium]